MNALDAVAERVAGGAPLDERDAAVIAASYDLIAIGMMADDVRRGVHGGQATFLRVLEVHVEAVPASVPAGTSAGEVRIVGRPSSIDAACAAVASARRLVAGAPLAGFSLEEIAALTPGGADARAAFARLKDAGLDAIADAPVDLIDRTLVESARDAGLLVERLSVDAPPSDAVALVARAHALQAACGAFRAFAPLPRTLSVAAPTTGYQDVKLVALARLWLRDIRSIQVQWPLYGPKLAQVALTMGADDIDGVAAVDSGALGARRGVLEEIRRNIRAAGLEPVERDGRFAMVASS